MLAWGSHVGVPSERYRVPVGSGCARSVIHHFQICDKPVDCFAVSDRVGMETVLSAG